MSEDLPGYDLLGKDPRDEKEIEMNESDKQTIRNVWDMFEYDDISTERLLSMTASEASRQLGKHVDECDVAEVLG